MVGNGTFTSKYLIALLHAVSFFSFFHTKHLFCWKNWNMEQRCAREKETFFPSSCCANILINLFLHFLSPYVSYIVAKRMKLICENIFNHRIMSAECNQKKYQFSLQQVFIHRLYAKFITTKKIESSKKP